MTIAEAVRTLRGKIGITQEGLATRLGLSARAITNYERGRIPVQSVLLSLARLAADLEYVDLARIFAAEHASAVKRKTEAATAEERALVRLILALARDRRHVKQWPDIVSKLLKAIDDLIIDAGVKHLTAADLSALEEARVLGRSQLAPSAAQKLESMAVARSRLTGESLDQARTAVLLDSPELYSELSQERGAPATGAPKLPRETRTRKRKSKKREK